MCFPVVPKAHANVTTSSLSEVELVEGHVWLITPELFWLVQQSQRGL